MASVILLDNEGGQVTVSAPWHLISLVYGRGYRPLTGTVAENIAILAEDLPPSENPNAITVMLGDLLNDASEAYAAVEAIAELVGGGGPHSHDDLYFTEAEVTTLLADKADAASVTAALAAKADTVHTHTSAQISDATDASSASTVVRRTAGGSAGFANVDIANAPSAPQHGTRKDWVDSALNLKANLASPTFTGTVGGITKSMVGLGSVDNTADTAKPVSTAQQTAIDAIKARSTHTGTQTASTISDLTEVTQDIVGAFLVAGTGVTVTYDDVANTFTINATGGGGSTDTEVVRDTIGSALVAGAGIQITVNDAGDTITIASTAVLPTRQVIAGTGLTGGGDLSADRTLTVAYGTTGTTAAVGNDSRFTTAASETVAGHAEIATAAEVATGSDDLRIVTPAKLKTPMDLKAPLASPTFTGTVGGITKSMVGLGSVDNTADSAKPVSTAQQTALDAKISSVTPGEIVDADIITQAAYTALGAGRPATRIYYIVG